MTMDNLIRQINAYINLRELIADLLIVSFFYFFNTLILPEGGTILTVFSETALVVLILLIDLAVPQFVSKMTASYVQYSFRFSRPVIFLARLTGWLVCAMLGFALPVILMVRNIIGEGAMLILILAGLVAVILSYVSGDVKKAETEKKENESSGLVTGIMMVLLVTTVIGGLVYMLTFFSNGKVLYGFLTLGGMIAGVVLIAYVFMEGVSRLTETEVFAKFIEPAVIIILVLLWQDLFHTLTESGKPAMVFFQVMSGILPVRILMMFEPPVKPLNILTGIAALSGYFWTLS